MNKISFTAKVRFPVGGYLLSPQPQQPWQARRCTSQAASARMLGTVQTGIIQSFCSLTLANLPQAVSFQMLHETREKNQAGLSWSVHNQFIY